MGSFRSPHSSSAFPLIGGTRLVGVSSAARPHHFGPTHGLLPKPHECPASCWQPVPLQSPFTARFAPRAARGASSLPGHTDPPRCRSRPRALIQRGRGNQPNSTNLQPFTRVRVSRCWSLLVAMPDFASSTFLAVRLILGGGIAGRADHSNSPHARLVSILPRRRARACHDRSSLV